MSVCDINLIATRRRQKQRTIALMRCSVYSLIALTVAVALVYAWMSMAMRLTAGRIAEVEARLNDPSLSDAIARIEFLETNIATLEPRVDLLEKVHDSEAAWIEVLRDVGSCIPQGVWISQLVSHRVQDEHTISIRGSASRQGDMQGDIGEFALYDCGTVRRRWVSFTVQPLSQHRDGDFQFFPEQDQAIIQAGEFQLRANKVLLAGCAVGGRVVRLGHIDELLEELPVLFDQPDRLARSPRIEPEPGHLGLDPRPPV